jgi:hypothetical protein
VKEFPQVGINEQQLSKVTVVDAEFYDKYPEGQLKLAHVA